MVTLVPLPQSHQRLLPLLARLTCLVVPGFGQTEMALWLSFILEMAD